MLEISEPCPAAWEQMAGTGAQRHCSQCNKAVHSLSDMDAASAAELLAQFASSQSAASGLCVKVRCDDEGVVLHEARAEPRTPPARLRLALQPVLLSAGLLAAACNTSPGHRSHAESQQPLSRPVRSPAGSPNPGAKPAVHELMGLVASGPPPKPEPPPPPCPGRDCDFESGF